MEDFSETEGKLKGALELWLRVVTVFYYCRALYFDTIILLPFILQV
jgi:hypothetical protein